MRRAWAGWVLVVLAGCGPSHHERTLSTLNVELDRWDGTGNFETTATDAYGRPLASTIDKGPLNYRLEIRSHGADGLPRNSDDIVVTRSERHGESTVTGEVAKFTRGVASATAEGGVEGVKKGLGFGKRDRERAAD